MTKRLWLAGVFGAAGLIGAYVAFNAPRSEPPLAVSVPARPSQPVLPAAHGVPPPMATASAPPALVAAAPVQRRQIDITCREDEIPVARSETPDPTDQRAAVLAGQQLLREIRDSLNAGGDAKSRALALFLASMDHSFDPRECEGNDCSIPINAQALFAARAASDLAVLSLNTKLPQAYAWALSACRAKAADPTQYPACGNVSVQHWADAAPDNAWPWLWLAVEAQNRIDLSGLESAMHRASLAGDWRHPGDEARHLLVTHLPATVSSTTVLTALAGVSFLHADKAGLGTVLSYCGANKDANRAQTCTRLAQGLLSSANDLFQLSVAIKVGERSGLPTQLLAEAETQRVGATANMASTVRLWIDPRRQCPFFQVQARVAIRSADVGELAAIQEQFRAQPR